MDDRRPDIAPLPPPPPSAPPRASGRFGAEAPNDLWTGDALHGPLVGGRRCYLFCFIDDHSRCLVGYRFGLAEDTLRLEAALRQGLASRGVPRMLFVDYADLRVMPTSPGSPCSAGV